VPKTLVSVIVTIAERLLHVRVPQDRGVFLAGKKIEEADADGESRQS